MVNGKVHDVFYEISEGIEFARKDIIGGLFEDLFETFIRVVNEEFRKKVAAMLGKKKKFSHSTEICVSHTKANDQTTGGVEEDEKGANNVEEIDKGSNGGQVNDGRVLRGR